MNKSLYDALDQLEQFFLKEKLRLANEIATLEREFDKVVDRFKDIPLQYEGIVTQPYAGRLYILRMNMLNLMKTFMDNKKSILENACPPKRKGKHEDSR